MGFEPTRSKATVSKTAVSTIPPLGLVCRDGGNRTLKVYDQRILSPSCLPISPRPRMTYHSLTTFYLVNE